MKKSLFLMAIATFAMVSCNNDDVLEFKQDELKFNVYSDNASRASDIFSSTNLIEKFKVSAYYANPNYDGTNGATISRINNYFANDVIAYEGGAWVNKTEPARFWPEDENLELTFMATNAESGISEGLMMRRLYVSHEVKDDVKEQFDLLYSLTPNQTRAVNAVSGVNLNFRHALSQIVFNAKNINNSLKVVVKSVSIANMISKGEMRYNLDAGSTDDNYVTSDGDITVNHPIQWDYITSGNLKTFITDFDDVTLEKTESKDLTVNNKDYAMLMIPQARAAWDYENEADYANTEGAYFLIDCECYNIGYTGENDTPVPVYEPVYKGVIPVPVNINWQAGKKYIYTLIFGGVPVLPNPLKAVTYNVTIDDFQETESTDVPV